MKLLLRVSILLRDKLPKCLSEKNSCAPNTALALLVQIDGSVYKSATGRSSTFAYVIKLCAFMHKSGWAPGTSGGILMKDGW